MLTIKNISPHYGEYSISEDENGAIIVTCGKRRSLFSPEALFPMIFRCDYLTLHKEHIDSVENKAKNFLT